jgi:chorismate lyase / 3-hydroxybenzoate synthase
MPYDRGTTPALRATFASLDPTQPLGDDVLTAVVFGNNTPCPSDPRCLRIGLEPLTGAGLCEVWRGVGRVRLGTSGPIRFVEDGHCLAGWIDLDEDRFGGLEATAEAAYRGLLAFHAASPFHYVWRIWNFVTAINEGHGDAERYKLFSLGRARAFAAAQATSPGLAYPAATAVGKPQGPRTLQVCWIAGRAPGTMLENPRQVAAYHYPRRYGPAAPSFSRAMLIPDPALLVSGTASIVGYASLHEGDAIAQLEETLANLDVLLQRARAAGHFSSARLGPESLLKVYLRPGVDAAAIERRLHERLGPDVPTLILAADICRSELLIEIEAVLRTSGATH